MHPKDHNPSMPFGVPRDNPRIKCGEVVMVIGLRVCRHSLECHCSPLARQTTAPQAAPRWGKILEVDWTRDHPVLVGIGIAGRRVISAWYGVGEIIFG